MSTRPPSERRLPWDVCRPPCCPWGLLVSRSRPSGGCFDDLAHCRQYPGRNHLVDSAPARTIKGRALGLEGEVVYADAGGEAEILISDRHRLVGRPDYILDGGDGDLIPVERKSRPAGSGPYDGEILQLAAYCALVENGYGTIVRSGRLQYADRTVDIAFDEQLRAKLADTPAVVRETGKEKDVSRSHNSPARCRGCGFRETCGESLAK
jgi:CRISPR-associated exonuclease Cas4